MILMVAGGIIGGGGILLLFYVIHQKKISKERLRVEKKNYPKDTAIVHGVGRSKFVPSLSPFPVKLETFLRITKIPHKVDFHQPLSRKNKTPWMTYNGEEIADSQICIEYLKKKLDIDLMKDLTEEEKAIAHSFRILIEEHLYWLLVGERYLYSTDGFEFVRKALGVPKWASGPLRKTMVEQAKAQGMGRHSTEEGREIGRNGLKALSVYLGNKRYLMGDAPCEVDCSMFGMISNLLYSTPGSDAEKYIIEECPNLKQHIDRMKENFWPDWEENLSSKPSLPNFYTWFFRNLFGIS